MRFFVSFPIKLTIEIVIRRQFIGNVDDKRFIRVLFIRIRSINLFMIDKEDNFYIAFVSVDEMDTVFVSVDEMHLYLL